MPLRGAHECGGDQFLQTIWFLNQSVEVDATTDLMQAAKERLELLFPRIDWSSGNLHDGLASENEAQLGANKTRTVFVCFHLTIFSH